jgi:DNA-binding NtrC family response regulator/ligand-binding sensor domain-containing protein
MKEKKKLPKILKPNPNHKNAETTFSDATSVNDTTPIPPTLARLSFWAPPERMAEFEVVYQQKIAPFLLQRGWVESLERGRMTVEGVFSRLFEVETLSEIKEKVEALRGDPAWHAMLRSLGATFGATDTDGRIRYHLGPYVVPSGLGTVVCAGQGRGCWRTFDGSNGLPDNWVHWILQDRDGNIWFATESGACRYDGYRLTTFTTKDGLAHNALRSMLQDKKGNLWFATQGGGVSRYDGQNWTTFTQKDGLAANRVGAICEDKDGRLWFGTASFALKGNGVSCYDGRNWTTLTTKDGLAHNNVFSIIQTRDGALWFGTSGGVSRYDGKAWTTFTTADGLAHNLVYSIIQDREGHLWFGTANGVSRYDGQTWTTLTAEDGLASNEVRRIFQDSDGVFWFCTSAGMSRYDGKTFTTLTTQDGLAANIMTFAFQDAYGALWFANAGGVNRYEHQTITTLTTQDGLVDDWVRTIKEDANGNLWFGTWNCGISRYDGITFTNFILQNRFIVDDDLLGMLIDSKGQLWLGTWNGYVQRYDGRIWTTFTEADGLSGRPVYALAEDKDGYIWLCTYEGVRRYDGQTFVTLTTTDSLASNQVRSMLQDREGNLWFGTWGAGVVRYDGQHWRTFTTKDGLAENRVQECYGIFQDRDGNLWFGTRSGGVSRYAPPHSPLRKGGSKGGFTTFTTADGLPSNCVSSIFQDSAGYLWFGTNSGACVFDGQVFQTFTQQDGLGSNCVWQIFEDSKGDIWFGTVKGVTRYRCPSPNPPRTFIDAVVADQRYVGIDAVTPLQNPTLRNSEGNTVRFCNGVTIPSNVGLVVFEFHAKSLRTRPEAMVYRYRLTGQSPYPPYSPLKKGARGLFRGIKGDGQTPPRHDWKNTKAQRVEYLELPPGDYTFEVQAVDQHLVYSQPATVTLTVEPDPEIVALQAEIANLRSEVGRKYDFSNIIGRSEAIKKVRRLMELAIDSGLDVLITGETGTGKELVAKGIHYNSSRGTKTPVTCDCSTLSKELAVSELFGHPKGAFTGADADKLGLFEAADGSTLILDEIGNLSFEVQRHLLRALEERKVRRLSETLERAVDVRVIVMTNLDLEKERNAGRFREDLYYRLNEFPIVVPPLRERREDIPLLAEHFLRAIDKKLDGFAPEVFEMLQSYHWPGNVRELQKAIQLAAAFAEEGKRIETYHFPVHIAQGASLIQETMAAIDGGRSRYRELVDEFERRCIEHALRSCNGNRTQAAKLLGLDRRILYDKIVRLQIDIPATYPTKTND